MGALEWRKIVHEHQRWRLLTCMWLHAGVIHLLTNMLSLIFINIHLEQQFGFSACKVKEPSVISPGGSKTEERQSHDVSNQNDMSQDGGDQPRGEVNMEASISAEDVIRAGGFGAKDDIGSFLPVASDSTDFEESIRSARDYEEPQPEVQRPGLGWPKE